MIRKESLFKYNADVRQAGPLITSPSVRKATEDMAFLSNNLDRLLFPDEIQGAIYDPSDLSTLFQDEHGTTPVTEPGDPVGLMLDKSGNGHHATQPTTASRPTYQTDGTLHWLDWDGVDDFMETPIGFLSLADTVASVAVAYQLAAGADAGHVLHSDGSQGSRVDLGCSLLANFSGAESFTIAGKYATVPSSTDPRVASAVWDVSEPEGTVSFDGDSQSVPLQGASTGNTLLIGSRAGSVFFEGRIYGLVITNTYLSESDRKRVENYLARKAGVTL